MTKQQERREKVDELRAENESPKHTYWVTYYEKASWGSGLDETVKRVKCDRVSIDDGVARFQLHDGTDVWAVSTDRLIEYDQHDERSV